MANVGHAKRWRKAWKLQFSPLYITSLLLDVIQTRVIINNLLKRTDDYLLINYLMVRVFWSIIIDHERFPTAERSTPLKSYSKESVIKSTGQRSNGRHHSFTFSFKIIYNMFVEFKCNFVTFGISLFITLTLKCD